MALAPVGIWTDALDYVAAGEACDVAAELEALGYGAIWVPEIAGRDPVGALTLLLGATTRLRGATGIANIWGRDAVAMTGATKAVTEAFPDRAIVGLGVSHPK